MKYHFPKSTDWTTFGPLTARAVIGKHYGVQCTEIEARAEVLSLARKADKGSLDDNAECLTAKLEVAYGVRNIGELARAAYRSWKCAKDCTVTTTE
jgi:hypothetical protein